MNTCCGNDKGFGNEVDDFGNDNKYTTTEVWLKHYNI